MDIEKEFKSEVRMHLDKISNDIIPVLNELIKYQYPEEVIALAFEVFYDGFSRGFPVRVFFLDEDNSEFFIYEGDEAQYPSPVDPGLLDIKQVYSKALEEKYSAKDENIDVYTSASEELIDWFSACWDKAGGQQFPRVAYIMIHDDNRALELKTKTWIED